VHVHTQLQSQVQIVIPFGSTKWLRIDYVISSDKNRICFASKSGLAQLLENQTYDFGIWDITPTHRNKIFQKKLAPCLHPFQKAKNLFLVSPLRDKLKSGTFNTSLSQYFCTFFWQFGSSSTPNSSLLTYFLALLHTTTPFGSIPCFLCSSSHGSNFEPSFLLLWIGERWNVLVAIVHV